MSTGEVARGASPAALLALIADDPLVLRVLAAYAALELRLADVASPSRHYEVAVLAAVPTDRIPVYLQRLAAARVLEDGGITEIADKLLQTSVQSSLRGRRGTK